MDRGSGSIRGTVRRPRVDRVVGAQEAREVQLAGKRKRTRHMNAERSGAVSLFAAGSDACERGRGASALRPA